MTDDEGRYIAGLDPDTYDVIAEATGFKAGYRKSIPIARCRAQLCRFRTLRRVIRPALDWRATEQFHP